MLSITHEAGHCHEYVHVLLLYSTENHRILLALHGIYMQMMPNVFVSYCDLSYSSMDSLLFQNLWRRCNPVMSSSTLRVIICHPMVRFWAQLLQTRFSP